MPNTDAQLLAAVLAIRAARGGVGNVTGTDLSTLRLEDARAAAAALRGLGWQIDGVLFDGDPTAAVAVTIPDLARETGHPLPVGEKLRSRVSGWVARTLTAKPVKKLPPAARLAGLFLAAHGTCDSAGQIPADLPEACRAALPDLLAKGFLAELSQDRYRLDEAVRHLSGVRPPTGGQATRPGAVPSSWPQFNADAWARWKSEATPALRRHVEAVEHCALCALPVDRVAQAFMVAPRPMVIAKATMGAYGKWKGLHPDRGSLAAEFTVAFRAEHGHGPSYYQLTSGLGWGLDRSLGAYVVTRLVKNEWLVTTGAVPWTLRPGPAAQAQGIALPKARTEAPGDVPAAV
ncbi:hypothetical protein [Kitasatospora acidiphila]|uniref:hypothetical protein n=1 Tax=Kitasatospora acidiphila TaxID=2567942 RepID=UPI001E57E0DD|nr:hypothetical protein [Kitasatospora acidiphila]